MIVKHILSIFLLLFYCSSYGQVELKNFRGYVHDEKSQPVADASVQIESGEARATSTTDSRGFFKVALKSDVSMGVAVRVNISAAGYENHTEYITWGEQQPMITIKQKKADHPPVKKNVKIQDPKKQVAVPEPPKPEPKKQPCPPWFEGVNCQTEMRQKFYGTYSGQMHEKDNHMGPYPATVTLSPGHDGVQSIYYYWQQGNDGRPVAWNITLTDSNKIIIPPTVINNNPGLPKGSVYTDAGSGVLNGKYLILNWTASNRDGMVHWSMTLTKE